MVSHVELNSWRQAEEHFRNVDQDQGRKHYDREMFNCELALNLMGIGTLYSCSGHLDGLAAFPYITIIPQRQLSVWAEINSRSRLTRVSVSPLMNIGGATGST